jgi:hypothetical protein
LKCSLDVKVGPGSLWIDLHGECAAYTSTTQYFDRHLLLSANQESKDRCAKDV